MKLKITNLGESIQHQLSTILVPLELNIEGGT